MRVITPLKTIAGAYLVVNIEVQVGPNQTEREEVPSEKYISHDGGPHGTMWVYLPTVNPNGASMYGLFTVT